MSVTSIACSVMALCVLACEIVCDCPKCQLDAFKSTQEHSYNCTVDIAYEYGIDEYILFAIMYRESRFTQDAIHYNTNGSIDYGICQINSINWEWLQEEGIDIYSEIGNIEASAKIISIYINEYGCTDQEAISAYGVGYSGMRRGEGLNQADELYEIIYKF